MVAVNWGWWGWDCRNGSLQISLLDFQIEVPILWYIILKADCSVVLISQIPYYSYVALPAFHLINLWSFPLYCFRCIRCPFSPSIMPGTSSAASRSMQISTGLVKWGYGSWSCRRKTRRQGKSRRAREVNKAWKTTGKKTPIECLSEKGILRPGSHPHRANQSTLRRSISEDLGINSSKALLADLSESYTQWESNLISLNFKVMENSRRFPRVTVEIQTFSISVWIIYLSSKSTQL